MTISTISKHIAVSSANVTPYDAGTGGIDFNVVAGSYTYTISNFGNDDAIDFPVGNTPSVFNNDYTDHKIELQYAVSNSNTVTSIVLTGLSGAAEFIGSFKSFNSVFGDNSITNTGTGVIPTTIPTPTPPVPTTTLTTVSTKPTPGSDILIGTAKNDVLSGLAGNDTLVGGIGADRLTGGKGADVFKFNKVEESGLTNKMKDTIMDFNHTEKDKIDLSAIDSNSELAGDQAFTFIGGAAFSKTNAAGQLRFDATSKILYGSTDADTTPEFSIQLSGVKSLVAGDFVL